MKRILILGAGGFGREVLAWARAAFPDATFGFLDDNPQAGLDPRLRVPVVGAIMTYQPQPGDAFLCAVGNPRLRRAMSVLIKERGGRFATLVHPTAIVAEGARLGEGVLICPYTMVSVDARIEDDAAVYYHSSVDHDAIVGACSVVSAHCDLTGGAVLGSEVFMGSHASVLPMVKVGHGAIIGAGAVVNRDVPDGAKVVGVPARPRGT